MKKLSLKFPFFVVTVLIPLSLFFWSERKMDWDKWTEPRGNVNNNNAAVFCFISTTNPLYLFYIQSADP